MPPVFDKNKPILVCDKDDTHAIDSALSHKLGRDILGQLAIYDLGSNSLSIELIQKALPTKEIHRYLDCFYLITSIDDSEHRQTLLDSFFDFIADNYESLIDVNRNMENISNLFSILNAHIDFRPDTTILDYGCGTGLAFKVLNSSDYSLNLLGFDRCSKMLSIARMRGMTAIGSRELAIMNNGTIDGVISSYTLHLKPQLSGIKLLWSRLKIGGKLVANHHKNVGIQFMTQYILGLGGAVQDLKTAKYNQWHGSYLVYVKK